MDNEKSPQLMHMSPNQAPISNDNPELLSLKQNEDDNGTYSNIQMIEAQDDSTTTDDENDVIQSEPIRRKKKPRHRFLKKLKPTDASYSELPNASTYSLKANESIADMKQTNEDDNPEGWPIFEPISGPYPLEVYRKDYKQLKDEMLSGFVVSFAQVPEAVAFSFLAGVDPFIGLHAAWIVGFITSMFGGRCAEISGATGATAAVLAPYMADPNVGVQYLPYIIGLVGIIIIFCGFIGVSKMIALVPVSCMIGFVNGLAIIIASAQLGSFEALNDKHEEKGAAFYGELAWMIALTVVTFCIVEYLPRFTQFVPSTLIALLFSCFVEHVIIRMVAGMETVLLGELGDFAGGLPKIPGVDPYWDLPPLNMETFGVILVPSLTVALVSTVEDLLTIEVVHDLTNTRPRSVEKCELIAKLQIIAMGLSNLVCGFFGAIGGGSTIGLSTVNCYSANGRYRWSGVTCSISTFFIVFIASPALIQIPAAALVGLMLVVVVHTFEWSSIPILIVTFLPLNVRTYLNDTVFRGKYNVHRKIRRADGIIILAVTIITVVVNLGYAIIAGVLVAALMYSWDSAKSLKHSSIVIKRHEKMEMSISSQQYEDSDDKYENFITEKNEKCIGGESEDKYEIVKIYTLEGPLLFSNANQLPSIFNWNSDPSMVEVHLQNCIVYDFSALNALNYIAEKYREKNKKIHLKHINIETKKSFQKANQLIPHFTYDMDVRVDDMQRFFAATRLNVTQRSRRHL